MEPGYPCTTAGGTPDLLGLPMIVRDFKPEPPFTVTTDTGISTGHSDFQWGGFGNADPDANLTDNWTNYPTLPGAGDAFTGGRTGNILGQGVVLGGGGGMEYGFVRALARAPTRSPYSRSSIPTWAMSSPCPLAFGALDQKLPGVLRAPGAERDELRALVSRRGRLQQHVRPHAPDAALHRR